MRVGAQVGNSRGKGALEKQDYIFKRYSLHSKVKNLFPFQLSGGMARRVLVASAIAGGAKLIIADEPTPGLHPEVAKETFRHLRELADLGSGVMLITHDIATAVEVADDIAVFYAGTVVEVAPAKDFTGKGELLRHPYSKALWNALPQNEFAPVAGFQPRQTQTHEGCFFYPMCTIKSIDCLGKEPEMRNVRDGKVRCRHAT
jgi:peptide/nickel transport system ATP-binding protein